MKYYSYKISFVDKVGCVVEERLKHVNLSGKKSPLRDDTADSVVERIAEEEIANVKGAVDFNYVLVSYWSDSDEK